MMRALLIFGAAVLSGYSSLYRGIVERFIIGNSLDVCKMNDIVDQFLEIKKQASIDPKKVFKEAGEFSDNPILSRFLKGEDVLSEWEESLKTQTSWIRDYFVDKYLRWFKALNIKLKQRKLNTADLVLLRFHSQRLQAACANRPAIIPNGYIPLDEHVYKCTHRRRIDCVLSGAKSVAYAAKSDLAHLYPQAIDGDKVYIASRANSVFNPRNYISPGSHAVAFSPPPNGYINGVAEKHENLVVQKILEWIGLGDWRRSFDCGNGSFLAESPFSGIGEKCQKLASGKEQCLKKLSTLFAQTRTGLVPLRELIRKLNYC
jgi:hypothetical protein